MNRIGMLFDLDIVTLALENKNRSMRYVLKLVFCMMVVSLSAQDIHFSQFYMSPANLNPALTGVLNCKMRFIANYRNQWAPILKKNAYNTANLSYDQKVPVGRYDYFGFGGTFWGDRAGSLDFQTLQFKLSGSYSKRMSGSRTSANYLVFGVEAGINQRSVNFHNAIWGTQITANGPDPNLPSGEPEYDASFIYPDIGVGLLWFSILNKYSNFYMGAAYTHLNEPDVKFLSAGQAVPLYPKLTGHLGGDFAIGRKTSILPGAVYFNQGKSWQVNAGTSMRFNMGRKRYEEQAFQMGVWARVTSKLEDQTHVDAVIVSARFDYEKFGVGLSYDINISQLSEASRANNAFELSLIYNICGPERRGIYCPNF